MRLKLSTLRGNNHVIKKLKLLFEKRLKNGTNRRRKN